MELKEMNETGVNLFNQAELDEYLQICEDGGWVWNSGHQPNDPVSPKHAPLAICAENHLAYGRVDCYNTNITLAEFKKEQGIMSMKYKAGDTLEYTLDDILVIQGIVGSVYVTLHQNGHTALMTEKDLDEENYTLKTDKPAKTDMTVSELEEKCGLPAGSLNVVAES